MRVIVTGATSFIGSHAVQTLINQGFEVCALIRPNSAGKKNLEHMIIKKELLEIIEFELSGLKELAVNAEKLSKIGQKWSHDLGRADYWLHLGWDGSGSDNRMRLMRLRRQLPPTVSVFFFVVHRQSMACEIRQCERQTSYIRFLSMERLRLRWEERLLCVQKRLA